MSKVNSEGRSANRVAPVRGAAAAWATARRESRGESVAGKARDYAMARIGALCAASWTAAAVLYFGRHSLALMALSGVIALAGFDLARPD